ncbi:hypothetical protein N7491_005340 [Penicillium cf. griseofulvum]|uniref:LysM domain-containing protein n=1 Tax=Penicillium cf. griseofulvum TaxID=2972120 RepID=A0A9W9J2Z5_9EURO|nr:hypothetical protein N7472_008032 [Penicillium cf. griseofulvum]KAJ5434745.1 hypothetical protein N7491_005340 [Penicillium cf. griseofulvum]KAJ5452576.1 hypothetical protein N7445_000759 [Penicillium cf. griseofulvum]
MRGADILSASILLCGATVAQEAGPYQHQLTLEAPIVNKTSSPPDFRGFQLWHETGKLDAKHLSKFSPACRASMTRRIHCHKKTRSLQRQFGRRSRGLGLGSDALSDLVCDSSCGESIAAWFEGVERDCATLEERVFFPAQRGGQLWAGWNETCLRNEGTERYCGDVIDEFTTSFIDKMPIEELCSFCNVQWYKIMQTSPYSLYGKSYISNLAYINRACNLTIPTATPKLTLFENPHVEWDPYCVTYLSYITSAGDTCDDIAAQFKVASAAIRAMNWSLIDCSVIPEGKRLCIPFSCKTYMLKDGDTCDSIERELNLKPWWQLSAIREYNPWVNKDCSNLHEVSDDLYGRIICVGPTGLSVLDV